MAAHWIVLTTLVSLIPQASSLWTDHCTRRAAAASQQPAVSQAQAEEATRRAMEELEAALRRGDLSPRTVEIPSNAFNADLAFTSLFASTAIIGVILLAKTADELRRLGMHIEDIRDELGAQTTAMVQGWQNEGFGAFIYAFLKTEIDDYGGEASKGHHAFYVYNPTTSADVVFKQKIRDRPLPSSFGGFSSDIEAIFRLMWANRQALRATMPRDAADAVVFHLLIPAKRTMAILDRMVIHESIGRLIIKGHMDEGSCYVWLNFIKLPPQVTLHHIRRLDSDKTDQANTGKVLQAGALSALACWSGSLMSSFVFPPATPVLISGFVASCASMMGTAIHSDCRKERRETRILGPPQDGAAHFLS